MKMVEELIRPELLVFIPVLTFLKLGLKNRRCLPSSGHHWCWVPPG